VQVTAHSAIDEMATFDPANGVVYRFGRSDWTGEDGAIYVLSDAVALTILPRPRAKSAAPRKESNPFNGSFQLADGARLLVRTASAAI
jgi:hypothetical protein